MLIMQVIDHYENPRNVGSMNKDDQDVGTGLVGAPACGDVMKLQVGFHYLLLFETDSIGFMQSFILLHILLLLAQIKVDENGRIIDAKFKTFGCGSAIASSSLATEWIKGKTVRNAF